MLKNLFNPFLQVLDKHDVNAWTPDDVVKVVLL